MTTYERIRMLRLQNHMTQEDVAKHMGYDSRSMISHIEKGKVDLPQSKIIAFAELFHVTPLYLMYGGPSERTEPTKSVPLIGVIACGVPITAEQNAIDSIPLPRGIQADFALRCKGDSMAPTILNGDVVYIRKQPAVENGQIAAVIFNRTADWAEATLKRVYTAGKTIQLVAENREYEPIVISSDESEQIAIAGLAVALHRELR